MSIQLKDVHKAFGAKQVLTGFTLEIHEGETLSIIGGSGTGKSVTLKHIVRLLRPDRGEVWVDGQVRFMCPNVGQNIILDSMEAAD